MTMSREFPLLSAGTSFLKRVSERGKTRLAGEHMSAGPVLSSAPLGYADPSGCSSSLLQSPLLHRKKVLCASKR